MSSRARPFAVINIGVGVLFLVSVGLQHNDPDPIRWVLIYGAAAAACFQLGRWHRDWLPPAATGLASIVWLLVRSPELVRDVDIGDLFKSMDDKGGAAELAREYGGLLIVATWMLVLLVVARRRGRG